jgi:PleD family two-component response regulator
MLNAAIGQDGTATASPIVARPAAAQKVVIVNGTVDILELLETALEAGHYDVVFVESNRHAYSQIKRVRPDLVILCVAIDDLDGFQVLSMLKMDEDTRTIPVLTYTMAYDSGDVETESHEVSDTGMFAPRTVELMN